MNIGRGNKVRGWKTQAAHVDLEATQVTAALGREKNKARGKV